MDWTTIKSKRQTEIDRKIGFNKEVLDEKLKKKIAGLSPMRQKEEIIKYQNKKQEIAEKKEKKKVENAKRKNKLENREKHRCQVCKSKKNGVLIETNEHFSQYKCCDKIFTRINSRCCSDCYPTDSEESDDEYRDGFGCLSYHMSV